MHNADSVATSRAKSNDDHISQSRHKLAGPRNRFPPLYQYTIHIDKVRFWHSVGFPVMSDRRRLRPGGGIEKTSHHDIS